jgi:TPR repeat protein
MTFRTLGDEMLQFAKSAASQRERDGFCSLGYCCERGHGCERDLEKAIEYYLIAARLGCVWSMNSLGRLLDESDIQRWVWWGRTATLGFPDPFLDHFSVPVQKFNSGSENGVVVFQISSDWSHHCREGNNLWQ